MCIGQRDGPFLCKCIEIKDCAKENDPVCGTDGKTYLNECFMKAMSCEKNASVGLRHRGRCGTVLYVIWPYYFTPF